MIESPYLDEIIREQVEKRSSLRVAEKLAEKLAEELPKRVAEKVAEVLPQKVAEELSKELSKELPKRMHRAIESFLKVRFGAVPTDITALIEKVTDDDELDSLNAWAGTCPDLASFRQKFSK